VSLIVTQAAIYAFVRGKALLFYASIVNISGSEATDPGPSGCG
jgi:hypothetical protein